MMSVDTSDRGSGVPGALENFRGAAKEISRSQCTGATFSKGDRIEYTSMHTASLFHLNCICIFQSALEQRSRVLLGLLLQYY